MGIHDSVVKLSYLNDRTSFPGSIKPAFYEIQSF